MTKGVASVHNTYQYGTGLLYDLRRRSLITLEPRFWSQSKLVPIESLYGWLRGSVVERRSLTGELSLSCARPVADG